MECPHCTVAFHDVWYTEGVRQDVDGIWQIRSTECPSCQRVIIKIVRVRHVPAADLGAVREKDLEAYFARPKASSRKPLPPEVPPEYRRLYEKAARVLTDAPEASAALSRRALQMVLEGPGKATTKNISEQIDEVTPNVPTWVSESLHGLREVGNFAAHPIKSHQTGTIVRGARRSRVVAGHAGNGVRLLLRRPRQRGGEEGGSQREVAGRWAQDDLGYIPPKPTAVVLEVARLGLPPGAPQVARSRAGGTHLRCCLRTPVSRSGIVRLAAPTSTLLVRKSPHRGGDPAVYQGWVG